MLSLFTEKSKNRVNNGHIIKLLKTILEVNYIVNKVSLPAL